MATPAQSVAALHEKVLHYRQLELTGSTRLARAAAWVARWAFMLYREFVRDEVKVRAESLAYLMLFSLLPLIAGSFFIFTIFTQFGMVQEAIQGFVNNILDTIPSEHRDVVQEYVLRFKDAYLNAIAGKSGKLGIFALIFLFWIGLQTFNNIENTLNHIWSAERARPLLEKIRNFIVVSVGAPLVLIASLSVPLILRQSPGIGELFIFFPILANLLNFVITAGIVLSTFTLLYRFVPVCRVRWRSAMAGGAFSAVLLQVANWAMTLYFRVGTNTAYGKAAVAPLIAFWIYLVWMIVILGAELSYLIQHEEQYLARPKTSASIAEAETLLEILDVLRRAYREGQGPVSLDQLLAALRTDAGSLNKLLRHLESRNLVLRAVTDPDEEPDYALARDLGPMPVGAILRDFMLGGRHESPGSPVGGFFDEKLEAWVKSLEGRRFGDFDVTSSS